MRNVAVGFWKPHISRMKDGVYVCSQSQHLVWRGKGFGTTPAIAYREFQIHKEISI